MTTPIAPDSPPAEFVQTLHEAIRRILQGEPLPAFTEWFMQTMGEPMAALAPQHALDQDANQRFQRHLASALWHAVPVPSQRWRPLPMPRPERNAPCPCGSGRKYKQCCAQFGSHALPVPAEQLHALALTLAEPHMLQPDLVRQVPPEALAHAASRWNEDGLPDRTIEVLEPLFADITKLDDRHEYAFEMLMNALQALGQEARSDALARRVATARSRWLATAARARHIAMLADRGELRAAWGQLHEAQRHDPDNPEYWPLEVTLMLDDGRTEEARQRATLLATRARRDGLTELAQELTDLGTQGLPPLADGREEEDEPQLEDGEDQAWVDLCRQLPTEIDGEELASLYQVTREPASGDAPPVLSLVPGPGLASVQARWTQQFHVVKPSRNRLMGDAAAVLDDLPGVAAFLTTHPLAWFSLDVLDDLLLAAAEIADPQAPRAVLTAADHLADHALTVLQSLIHPEPAQLMWMYKTSQPALRVVAQAISFANLVGDFGGLGARTRFGLDICPSDPFHWRTVRAELLLRDGLPAEALEVIETAQGDQPLLAPMRALALFTLGRRQQAEAALRAAHVGQPQVLATLLPDLLDAPLDDDEMDDEEAELFSAAWMHRMALRPAWVRSGALAWLRGLDL